MSAPTPLKANMYDTRVYHLDLCILAYHLYHQSLIWPMDPYYESMTANSSRTKYMEKVIPYFQSNFLMNDGYRGPGSLIPLPHRQATNAKLDPIITKYDRVNPWVSSFIRPETDWEFISPSEFITEKIKNIYRCEQGAISSQIIPNPDSTNTAAQTDDLYCFEGTTGSIIPKKSTTPTPPAWSLMGFVLARDRGGTAGEYDIHITFRGSRSGSAFRAAAEGIMFGEGNADWVTDMDFKKLMEGDSLFGAVGGVSEGFALSMKRTYINILQCMEAIYNSRGSKPPINIYVTGHSLGGALAAMCACLLSERFNTNNYTKLADFPFETLRLLSYSAPTVGNMDFVNYFNSRVSAARFLIDGDPVTSGKAKSFGVHVGARVFLPKFNGQSKLGQDAHEPKNVRAQLIDMLTKEKINLPDTANSIFDKYGNFHDLFANPLNAEKAKSLKDCFNNFENDLELYLKIYQSLATDQKIKTAIDDFIKPPNEDISKVNGYIKTMAKDNTAFKKFLYICVVLRLLALGRSYDDIKSTDLSTYGINPTTALY